MSKLSDALCDVLLSVGKSVRRPADESVTGFFPLKGNDYRGQLMVVGRSVNGWADGISVSELENADAVRTYVDNLIKEGTESGKCPMSWVEECWGANAGYNSNRSAFWRVIKQCAGRMGVSDTESSGWASSLVWSNLYKVSPSDGHNPGVVLRRSQQEAAISMLHTELELLQPAKLILLTGTWADPFIKGIPKQVRSVHSGVETGTLLLPGGAKVTFVVAPHPMCKAEKPIVDSVVSALAES